MTNGRPPLCAEVSRADDEPLAATASRIDRWLLVEYRGLWAHDALDGSGLSGAVKERLRALVAATPRSRVLFVRRPERHDGIRVIAASSVEGDAWTRGLTVDSYDELLDVDLELTQGEAVDHALFLVCTHGKHDPCCAKFGRPLYDALREGVEPGRAWQSTHVGGDRFAGNLVALPHGLYFGRLEAAEALDVVDAVSGGRILLDRYRGRSCYSFPVQAAERALREARGLVGIGDLRLQRTRRVSDAASDTWDVRFEARGETWAVQVARTESELTHLTCKARELRRPQHYAAAGPPVRVA